MPAIQGKNVLIVDDEADLREIFCFEFEFRGARCVEAANGQEALQVFQKGGIDVIVSDVRMPGGDGIELLNKIRSTNKNDPIFIIITGFADLSVQEAKAKGAQGLEPKPVDWERLFKTIENELKQRPKN